MNPTYAASSAPSSLRSLDDFLSEVEATLLERGLAYLYCGNRLGLQVSFRRQSGSARVKWGIKPHEDWVFKATFMRFARNAAHAVLVVEAGHDTTWRRSGWIAAASGNGLSVLALKPQQIATLLGARSEIPSESMVYAH